MLNQCYTAQNVKLSVISLSIRVQWFTLIVRSAQGNGKLILKRVLNAINLMDLRCRGCVGLVIRKRGASDLKIPWHKRVYALYKGDQFISEGTIREISRETNKTVDFLKYMTYPVYQRRCGKGKKRLMMISLDD
ncbi:hypothetical protein [Neobacillus massiliamazoniensis]|uniref:Uncharacterized protein n=1 Tax=Neobacillus massiliamazoniensis TaxID=1499688 RepID=A0A0U1NQT0_9BACI|nr:hypothetical protein [Neobacillus massiliamazoniensis]CRK80335.1 hypothetical protein BN000_00216 [Neobacillus massiliamazoniensis]